MSRYDVIVVGAGGSGAPLAARISEDADRAVLVLEAGPAPESAAAFPPELLHAGTLRGAEPGHPNTWSVGATLFPGRDYAVVRGRILGGSTSTNGGYFVRARRSDFEGWGALGQEWAFERMLPALRRLETDADYGESALHGGSGPMLVGRPRQDDPVTTAFAGAAAELGIPLDSDKNGGGGPGYGPLPMNVSAGVRWNTALAYLVPALGRPNLTVRGDSVVRRVLFEGRQATGVEVERRGVVSVVRAGEVVLCAGAVESAALLLRSGVGPRGDLEVLGIPVVRHSPGVGTAFSDHPQVTLSWRPARPVPIDEPTTMASVVHAGSGVPAAGGIAHPEGDIEILPLLKPVEYLLTGRIPSGASDLGVLIAVQAADSRGRLALASADPGVPPRIEYRYLETADDRRRMRAGVRQAAALLRSRPFAELFEGFTDLDERALDDDDVLDSWVRAHLGTAVHLSGSAPFGPAEDAAAVVDQYGRVHGLDGLRVADTSILPTVPTRGPAATAVLIGERVAEFVRSGH
jgi:predicted dehydrogenase (TIGR03970 family)